MGNKIKVYVKKICDTQMIINIVHVYMCIDSKQTSVLCFSE